MSESQPPPDRIRPYLNPDYWGNSTDAAPPVYKIEDWTRGLPNLVDYLRTRNSKFPLETFGRDQTFDARAFALGTIVVFRTEYLILSSAVRPNDASVDQPLPLCRTDLSLPSANTDETTTVISSDLGVYSSTIWWGEVVQAPQKTPRLAASMPVLWRGNTLERSVREKAKLHPNPLPIGVSHVIPKGGLARYTALEVCAYGTPERKKRPALLEALLGRRATG